MMNDIVTNIKYCGFSELHIQLNIGPIWHYLCT